MRICILTVGTRGDVQPYVALGTALRAAGHEVKLATLGRFEALVRAYGLEFALFEESPLSFLERVIASGGSFLRRAYETKGILDSMMERLLADALRFAQEADLIITSNLLIYPGYQLSKLLSVPSIGTLLAPYLRTRVFPNPAFCSGRHSLTGPGNLLTYDIFNEAVWQLYRGSMNRHQRRFGFRPLPRWGTARQMLRDHYPFLCAYSPSIVPRPTDWSDDIHVTGYWFLDAPTHWEPPAALQAFLDAGPPPVYIGFGSMTSADPVGVARLIVEALEQSGQRGVVQNDSLGISQVDASDEVLLLNSTPHDWLFPQMAAVVHHGGAGTAAAACGQVCRRSLRQPTATNSSGATALPSSVPAHLLSPEASDCGSACNCDSSCGKRSPDARAREGHGPKGRSRGRGDPSRASHRRNSWCLEQAALSSGSPGIRVKPAAGEQCARGQVQGGNWAASGGNRSRTQSPNRRMVWVM